MLGKINSYICLMLSVYKSQTSNDQIWPKKIKNKKI